MKNILLCFAIAFLLSACASRQRADWAVIAHRAASGYVPEHTLEAVAMAAAWNPDFIEPDVVLTKDSVPVVLHDIYLEKSTDVAKKFPKRARKDGKFYVVDFTLEEIKTLRVLERGKGGDTDEAVFPGRFPRDKALTAFQIPTLQEYLELIDGLRKTTGFDLGIYPEMKKPAFHESEGKDIVKVVYLMLKEYGYEQKPNLIFLQCFDPNALKRVRADYGDKIPLVQLIGKNEWGEAEVDYGAMLTPEGLKQIATYANGIGPFVMQLYSTDGEQPMANDVVAQAHELGLKVHPYTHRSDGLPPNFENDDAFLSFLYRDLKVDGLFTDFADKVLNWKVPPASKKASTQFGSRSNPLL